MNQAQELLLDLVKYLQSSKFNYGDDLDRYVNVQDVLNRLEPIISALQEA